MSRFCVSWTSHNWVRDDALALDRHCSKCGLIEPRPHNRPNPDFCNHAWEHGTFRRRCMKCGTVDRNVVLPPPRMRKPTVKRSAAWRNRVQVCWDRDGEGCFYCGRALLADTARLDHFIPRSRGGPDSLDNRRVACERCDVAKASRMPWEFMPDRFPAPESGDPGAGGVPGGGTDVGTLVLGADGEPACG